MQSALNHSTRSNHTTNSVHATSASAVPLRRPPKRTSSHLSSPRNASPHPRDPISLDGARSLTYTNTQRRPSATGANTMAASGGGTDSWRSGGEGLGPSAPVFPGSSSNGNGRGGARNGAPRGGGGGGGPSSSNGAVSSSKKQRGGGGGAGGQAFAPPAGPSKGKKNKGGKKSNAFANTANILPAPAHTLSYLTNAYHKQTIDSGKIEKKHLENPKNPLTVYVQAKTGEMPRYVATQGYIEGATPRELVHRVTVWADQDLGLRGYGDARSVKDAEKAAAFDAMMLLAEKDLLWTTPKPSSEALDSSAETEATLSNGTKLNAERAREFMEFYCQEFGFGKPVIDLTQNYSKATKKAASKPLNGWRASMVVGGTPVGEGSGANKKAATTNCYIDTVCHIESHDADLYARFDRAWPPGSSGLSNTPFVYFRITDELNDEIRDVVNTTTSSLLYSKRPKPAGRLLPGDRAGEDTAAIKPTRQYYRPFRLPEQWQLDEKNADLSDRLRDYHASSQHEHMRKTRNQLPVYQKRSDILVKVALNQVMICMAATGSGKSTQVPQILLDDAISENQGASCNVICTQPRRIAAISLAQRVASERGEMIGQSVGYQVRFESQPPEPNGSITYCTTGVFMRRLQNALGEGQETTWLDTISHIVLDEVHERDVQTDLLLVVLKKVLDQRREAGKPDIKVILMSATVDPKLFQAYFPDSEGKPAPVVEIPGRAFPVEKHFMEETIPRLRAVTRSHYDGAWVWQQKNVAEYVHRELDRAGGLNKGIEGQDVIDDLEIPYPLVSLFIADALTRGDDGHVLVFLPGWDEIKVVHSQLLDTRQFPLLGINFNDSVKYEIHILHSSIPVADQQAVFTPPSDKRTRRIILSTNIAETSVTIPDVTVVIDTGRVKEMRYDPSKHLSSLVSAWVGTSNLNQRAGRAGRHRPGEYFGVLSRARYNKLAVNQTVEMQRADLTDVVLHIKALDMPGMEPEDVLAAAIEPPSPQRVAAAMQQLHTIGALDAKKALTSLGAVLLQLPVDAAMGKMVLYGVFFRCLEPAVTLAAILSTRDPFLAPIDVKKEAAAVKESWSPQDYRSDPLAVLRAYQSWVVMQDRGEYVSANRFAHDNFLSKLTLVQIQKVAGHIVQSMRGIIESILGYSPDCQRDEAARAPELNVNSKSTPLLAALIAMASVPNFAVRKSEKIYMTNQDKACFIHPSSVCHLKHTKGKEEESIAPGEKEVVAFADKTRNVSLITGDNSKGGGGDPQTNLKSVSRLDPLTYVLFGACRVKNMSQGVICDDWLPVKGHWQVLDDVERLKSVMDASMLRVFEGLVTRDQPAKKSGRNGEGGGGDWDAYDDDAAAALAHNEDQPDNSDGFGDRSDLTLTAREVDEFEALTRGIVSVLDHYAADRRATAAHWNGGGGSSLGASRASTRPASPAVGFGGGQRGYSSQAGGGGYGGQGGGGGYGGQAAGGGYGGGAPSYNGNAGYGGGYGGGPSSHANAMANIPTGPRSMMGGGGGGGAARSNGFGYGQINGANGHATPPAATTTRGTDLSSFQPRMQSSSAWD